MESNLLINNKELMKQYNYDKNDIDFSNISIGSGKKIWWKCDKGHEWVASVDNRARGRGCPYCGNKKVLTGYNDLATVNPKLAKEWNYKKNCDLTPEKVNANNGNKVWWICDKKHEWEATIISRNRGTGCPYCSNQRVLKGYNDLLTNNSELVKEWNYKRNKDFKPDMVTENSNKKVWWKCSRGHEWKAVIFSRNKGAGCPICAKEMQTSFPEQAIYFYIKQLFPDAINSDQHIGMELDIFIPSKNTAIEYDGVHWHKNKKSDEKKDKLCEKNNIVLFRIKENGEEELAKSKYLKIIPCKYSDNGLKTTIELLAKYLGKKIQVNLDKDRNSIYMSFITNQKEHSLLSINPDLAKEWDYKKNGDLMPDMVVANSGKKVWWICKNGHEWQSEIRSRNNGTGCPYCSNVKLLKGYNDLTAINPKLAKEWNYKRNGNLTPTMVVANSGKKVWWLCDKGHEWENTIIQRNQGHGCPICANMQLLKGYNDLATVNPKLAKKWNYRKNKDLTPNDVTANNRKKVWWICSNGHEWEASIINRNRGTDCPICSNKQILKGYNDLATINPELTKEWNYAKNKNLTPDNVTANSKQKVWWICSKGHEWEAIIANRNRGRKCPICSSKKILKEYNDLATINPKLAKEWNYKKNGNLTPYDVTTNSNKKVWWICNKGHEWEAIIANRNKGRKCPYCSNQKILKGYNDLKTVNPKLATEWNHSKNKDLNPDTIAPNSHKKVWWVCSKGHEWEAEIRARNRGSKCPICKE